MSALDAFWAAPPVTRTLTAACVVLSLATHLGPLDPYWIVWLSYRVFTFKTIPEIWRTVTSFLLSGPQLGLIMDPLFLFQNGKNLETGSPIFGEPGSFFVYITFVAAFILISNTLYFGGMTFLQALTLAMAYTYAQENPNAQVNYIIVTFAAKWLPYAMLAVTFLMAGPEATLVQFSGLLGAHLYLFLTKIWPEHGGGPEVLKTPIVVRNLFESSDGVRQRSHGTAFAAGRSQAVGGNQTGRTGAFSSGSSAAAGTVRSAWASRGAGQRLGGD